LVARKIPNTGGIANAAFFLHSHKLKAWKHYFIYFITEGYIFFFHINDLDSLAFPH
jgi:hypothetical protein